MVFRASRILKGQFNETMPGAAEHAQAEPNRHRYSVIVASSRLTAGGIMDGTSSSGIDQSTLTKGQRRKLNALRKSVGDTIGERTFAKWLATQEAVSGKADGNAATIVNTLWPLVEQGTLAIPRGGYLIRRGRGRIIVEAAKK